MSTSMWAWRVVIPGLALGACLLAFLTSGRVGVTKAGASGGPDLKAEGGPRVVAEGRLVPRPGAEVTVGTESGGTVLALPIREGARVKKGDLLVEFRFDDQAAALAEAEARLAEADAELEFQKGEQARLDQPSPPAASTGGERAARRRDLDVAKARRRAASAAVDRGRAALARTLVTSPIDGVVLGLYVEPGETAPPSGRLATVCDLARGWIEAEVDEFDAAHVALGDPARVTAEGGDLAWLGRVEEVPDRVSDRTVRPDDPGRPSDSKVLRVKVALENPAPLKLGQKVRVEIRPKR